MSALLEAISNATEADLAEIESGIEQTARELAALKVAEKLLRARLGQARPNKPASRDDGMSDTARTIFDLVDKEGPLLSPTIARRTGLSQRAVTMCATRSKHLRLDEHGKIATA